MRTFLGVAAVSGALLLAGCSGSPISNTMQTGADQGVTLKGRVYGGEQPISGASLYLYAASTTGYGGASVSLLNSDVLTQTPAGGQDNSGNYYVTTASDGSFNIGSDYTCPSATTQVYLYALGGNPGGGVNPAAGMLAGLGSCGNLTPSTFIVINEVSTVATAFAIEGFATDATHVFSSSSTLGQTDIVNAFAAIPNLETLGTGAALGITPAGNGYPPQATINTLANILEACTNSTGSGSSQCSVLFSNAMNGVIAPTDTATAAINIAHNPSSNTYTLYSLQPAAGAAFVPDLGPEPNGNDAPTAWTISIYYDLSGVLEYPVDLAIDASGNVWVAAQAGVTVFSPVGEPLPGSVYSGAGIASPAKIAIDAAGNAWVTNIGDNSLGKLSYNGSAISGSEVYNGSNLNTPQGIAIDGSSQVWVVNNGSGALAEFNSSGSPLSLTSPGGDGLSVAIDPAGDVWATDGGGVSRFSWSGGTISRLAITGGGINQPSGIAIGASGNVWITDEGTFQLSELDSSGTPISGSPYSGGALNFPTRVAVDGAGNIWVGNREGIFSEFASSGTAITNPNGFSGAGYFLGGMAIDGSGNLWTVSSSTGGYNTLTQFVGIATPVVTPLAANLQTGSAVNRPY